MFNLQDILAKPDFSLTKKYIPFGFAKRFGILIIGEHEQHAIVVYRPDMSSHAIIELRRHLHQSVLLQQIPEDNFNTLLSRAFESDSNETMQIVEDIREDMDLALLIDQIPKAEDLLESEDDAPIIRLLNAIFTQAVKQNASDIHIETYEDRMLVRFRVDGVLREILEPQRVLAPLVISRIKVMGKLDIAEKRLPQDGRISIRIGGRNIDIRLSTMPSNHGERVVLRLLDKNATKLKLETLGMPSNSLSTMRQMIYKPHGIILVTGPTGSGKTTTLYAALTELNDSTRNMLTVEDPIEYDLPGVGQTQVNIKTDMTFAKGLRAILRQDPDVVMIGEIRDLETAEIAVQASLTGHLVLSTLHTNTAVGAIARLRDMGVESFLLSSSLLGAVGQRLVRLLCQHCKQPKTASAEECANMQIDNPVTIYTPVGCEKCDYLGYRGRTGIYEIFHVDQTLRIMIHDQVNEQTMLAHIRKSHLSMFQDGIQRVLAGTTSLEEVLRVSSGG